MLKESQVLMTHINQYFLRHYQWRYHILVVDNHLFGCYSFFLQARRNYTKLVHSYDLVEFKHDPELYREVLHDLKAFTNLTIEYRDTHHLVHPGMDIKSDMVHGHS